MHNQTKQLAAVCLWLMLFLFPAYNWFTKSDVIAPYHAASTPPIHHRPIRWQPQSDVNAPVIQSSAPAAPQELADWLPVRQTRTSFRKCKPRMNMVYLKTHKTASSTLQNIVCRWGERNNLTFALPISGVNIKYPLATDQLVPSPSRFYNILANHARFEPHAFHKIMSPDAVYITILRDPREHYESFYNYFHCEHSFGVPLDIFLRSPQQFLENGQGDNPSNLCVLGARNPQLYDLGFDSVRPVRGQGVAGLVMRRYPVSLRSVDAWVDVLNKSFHLVLIADYFKESLVALKDTMCWDIDDVVVFDVNRRLASQVTKRDSQSTLQLHDSILKWNAGDARIFHHFNQTLWRRLALIGQDTVSREIKAIQKRTYELVNQCLDNIQWISDTEYRTKAAYQTPLKNVVETYTLKQVARKDPLCQRLVLTAPNFLEILRRKMLVKLLE